MRCMDASKLRGISNGVRSEFSWIWTAGFAATLLAAMGGVGRIGRVEAQQAGNLPPQGQSLPATEAATDLAKIQAIEAAKRKLKVVANVNGQDITREQLAQECLRRYGTDVLESLVNKQLIWQECQKRGIAITNQDVEDEVNRMAAKFGLATSRWLQMLHDERGITPDQYRREIIWPTLALRLLARDEIQVSQAEMQKAFESEYGPRVRARLILVSSQEKANQLHAQVTSNPELFEDLAKEHSEDQSASVRGLIPPIRRHLGDENFERVAFGLKEGEVSPVFQVANKWVILKCEKHLPAQFLADHMRRSAEQQLAERIQDQKMRVAAADLFKRLQEQAQVTNVLNDPSQHQRYPGVAALINGKQIPIHQLAEECVIRHGTDVLAGEVNRVILVQALKRRGREVTKADIDREIARAAASFGFFKSDGSADVERWLKTVSEEDGAPIDLYVQDAVWPTVALKQLVTEKVTVTDEDMQRGFESNYGERVEVLLCVFNNQRQAQKIWEMARANPTEQFFGDLANQYSVDPVSRENFGKVPPVRKYGGRPKLEQEAFSLKPGELSGIIEIEGQYVFFRCLGRTTPVVTTMDNEVRQELHDDIYERKLRGLMTLEFDRLVESAQIDNFLEGTSQSGKAAASARSPRATLRTSR